MSDGRTDGGTASESASADVAEGDTGFGSLLDPREMPTRQRAGLLAVVLLLVMPLGNLLNVESITLIGGMVVPLSVEPLTLLKLTSALYFGMFAMSWDVVSGYTGQISFGHGLFFGVGGYTSALLNLGHGVDPILAVVAGTVLATVAGVIIGVPALRLRGPYLSLVTLVAPLILLQLFILFSGTFGGELGLPQPDNFLGFGLGEATLVYYVALLTFLLVTGVLLAVTRSDAGKVFTAIREDEVAVAATGINPAKFKIFAFLLSAAVGGFAGAMFVHTPRGAAQPSQLMSVTVNVEVIIAAILGGMGTIVGAAVGGMFLILFRDFLSNVEYVIPVMETPVADIDFLLFAFITLILLFILPGGALRWAIRNARKLRARFDDTPADGGRDTDEVLRGSDLSDPERSPVKSVYENWKRELRRWKR